MTWIAKAAMDAKLDYIRQAAEEIRLINTYAAGDTYATVNTNSVGSATITSGDFSATADGTPTTSRRMSFTGASGTASADDSGLTLWMAIVDVTGTEVLAVTDETTDQAITNTNPITFPTFYIQDNQPTQV